MPPPPRPKRITWKGACCLVAAAALTLMLAFAGAVLWGGFTLARWWPAERKYREAEHLAWPKPTPLAGLVTHSPNGALITRAGKHGGDGRGSHSERHDCVYVGPSSCPNALVEFTAQDHASCEDTWLACDRTDGKLLHEQLAMKLRWLDASRIEVSWTELTGVDAKDHRIWGRRSAIYRVEVTRTPGSAPCEGISVHTEMLTLPDRTPAP
jgi:hypothetical protein